MNDARSSESPLLPHHRLIAFQVAKQLLLAVRDAHIRDAKLRDEAIRSAKSACLNTAEAAGRVTRAEAGEAAAAVEIAALLGDRGEGQALATARIADRLIALLTGLCR